MLEYQWKIRDPHSMPDNLKCGKVTLLCSETDRAKLTCDLELLTKFCIKSDVSHSEGDDATILELCFISENQGKRFLKRLKEWEPKEPSIEAN